MLNIAKHSLKAREALDTSLSNIRDLRKSWTKKDYLIWRGPKGEFKDKRTTSNSTSRVRAGVEVELSQGKVPLRFE